MAGLSRRQVIQGFGSRILGLLWFRVFLTYLSGIMGNQRLTFFIIPGLDRDCTTQKRLKVTYSTSRVLYKDFGALTS